MGDGRADMLETDTQRLQDGVVFDQVFLGLQRTAAFDVFIEIVSCHHAPQILHQAADLCLLGGIARRVKPGEFARQAAAKIGGDDLGVQLIRLGFVR